MICIGDTVNNVAPPLCVCTIHYVTSIVVLNSAEYTDIM
jgi:hypothetical protein